MKTDVERFVGQVADIIYMDRRDRITQRTVVILGVRDDAARVYCFRKRAPRLFRLDRILAVSARTGGRTG